LTLVLDTVPWDAKGPGDDQDGVKVKVEGMCSIRSMRIDWHADEGEIINPFQYVFNALRFEDSYCHICWKTLDSAQGI